MMRRDGGGHGSHEGMEEMGIMTANFAWERQATAVKRPAWVQRIFSLPEE
jgi:hypothetical protein